MREMEGKTSRKVNGEMKGSEGWKEGWNMVVFQRESGG